MFFRIITLIIAWIMQPFLLRALDIGLALIGIICSLPIMLLIYIIGLFDNGSPLFFQQRVGKNQKLFTLIKFRTMDRHTHSVGTHLVDSSSITRLGHFLRKTKFDELPQLFKVLSPSAYILSIPIPSRHLEVFLERSSWTNYPSNSTY